VVAASDECGGVIIAWHDCRNYVEDDIHGQRIGPQGDKLWEESGVAICTAPGIQSGATVVGDGQGGVIAVWTDKRDIYTDIYAQRINPEGNPQWGNQGIPVCKAGGNQSAPQVVRGNAGHFLIAWLDYRDDYGHESQSAVFGQVLDREGKNLWAQDGVALCTADGYHLKLFRIHDSVDTWTIVWSDARTDYGDIYARRVHKASGK
jgi:hypothetical protein